MISIYVKEIADVWFGVGTDDQVIFATTFASDKVEALESLKSSVPSNVACQQKESLSAFARNAITFIKNIYDGKDGSNSFSLSMKHLTPYTKRVLETTLLIPVGYTASYGAVAKAVGGSPRAVGHAMATNPFAPIVPCHRVVSSDFTLGGYGGGLQTKLEFLKREKRGYTSESEIDVGDKKLHVSPVELVIRKVTEKKKR